MNAFRPAALALALALPAMALALPPVVPGPLPVEITVLGGLDANEPKECNDGKDNDGDGTVDHQGDPSCFGSQFANDEAACVTRAGYAQAWPEDPAVITAVDVRGEWDYSCPGSPHFHADYTCWTRDDEEDNWVVVSCDPWYVSRGGGVQGAFDCEWDCPFSPYHTLGAAVVPSSDYDSFTCEFQGSVPYDTVCFAN